MGIVILGFALIGLVIALLYARDIAMRVYRKVFGFAGADKALQMKQASPAMQPMAGDTANVILDVGVVAKPGKTPKPKFVGRYNKYSVPELTPWEDLPKYNGATGWFGFAKYKDVVVPNKHYYPSVAYMDTAVKQYAYDVMAARKSRGCSFQKMGRVKAWGSLLMWPVVFSLGAATHPNPMPKVIFIWSVVALLWLAVTFYFGPAGTRAGRRSAEGHKNLTPADWDNVYLRVAESQARVDEMRRAGMGRHYVRGKHP